MREIYLPPYNRDFSAGRPGDFIIARGFGGGYGPGGAMLTTDPAVDEQFRVDSGFFMTQPVSDGPRTDPSPKITVDDDGNQFLIFENSPGDQELYVSWLVGQAYDAGFISGRFYFNISELPAGDWIIFSVGNWGEYDPDTGVPNPDPIYAYLQVFDDATLQWFVTTDGTITTATAVGPRSTRAFEPGRWNRIEWNLLMTDGSIGAGQCIAQLYFDDVQATTSSEDILGFPDDMGSLGGWLCKMGVMGATPLPAGASYALDNISYDINAEMPGPYRSYYPKYELGDLLYPEFEPLTDNMGDPELALRTYCRAVGLMMQEVRDMSADGPNGEPGWSQVLDANRVRAKWLGWLAQMVGYLPPAWQPERDDEAAYLGRQVPRMIKFSKHNRGSTQALVYAIEEELLGKRQVNVFERTTDGWHMEIQVFEWEIATSPEAIYEAALKNKAAGILLPDPPVTIVPTTP